MIVLIDDLLLELKTLMRIKSKVIIDIDTEAEKSHPQKEIDFLNHFLLLITFIVFRKLKIRKTIIMTSTTTLEVFTNMTNPQMSHRYYTSYQTRYMWVIQTIFSWKKIIVNDSIRSVLTISTMDNFVQKVDVKNLWYHVVKRNSLHLNEKEIGTISFWSTSESRKEGFHEWISNFESIISPERLKIQVLLECYRNENTHLSKDTSEKKWKIT